MIEEYFQSLLDLIASLPFVESPDVSLEKRGDVVGFIRGEVEFNDGSILFFRELIDLRLPLQKVMYAYHYQRANGSLAFRYDSTAHHKHISTFPNHKHLPDGKIESSDIPVLEQVMREIERLILRD
ncbi:MAG: DUF6516 family protein [Anaerolineales bacterium]